MRRGGREAAAPDLLTYLPLDLADPEQIRNVPEQLRRLGLEPDYAVFCASVLSLDTFERFPRDKWLRMFQINLIGTLDLCQALLPFMRDGGRIVFLTSAVMFKGLERYGPYAATKAALAAFARCLAKELGPRRITVNTVAPGFILTPLTAEAAALEDRLVQDRAIRRKADPGDVVGTVRFLLSDDAAFMTGQTLVVDGGSVMR